MRIPEEAYWALAECRKKRDQWVKMLEDGIVMPERLDEFEEASTLRTESAVEWDLGEGYELVLMVRKEI